MNKLATAKHIKIELVNQDLTVSELARRCEKRLGRKVHRQQVSMCISGQRQYSDLKNAIAGELGKTVEQVFGLIHN